MSDNSKTPDTYSHPTENISHIYTRKRSDMEAVVMLSCVKKWLALATFYQE